MVDAMAVLGAAAAAKLAGDRLVRDFVAYIRETSSTVSTTAQAYTSTTRKQKSRRPRKGARLSRPMKPSTSGLGRRPSSSRLSKKVSTMTDAELEAELDARRRRRARERDMYSRAMRSDKLAALESELDSLRREIGRLDYAPDIRPASTPRAGTPPTSRWEALPRSRRSPVTSAPFAPGVPTMPVPGTPAPPAPPRAGGPPPPPPPPPPPRGADDDGDGLTIDPERQKREKAERQKRREAKKKEREQTQKKMTLADIIRSAGPDPARRLKPATQKPADEEKQEWERAKREREEREERQEKERIEKERLAKEGSQKRVAEKSADEKNDGKGSEDKEKADAEETGSKGNIDARDDKGEKDHISDKGESSTSTKNTAEKESVVDQKVSAGTEKAMKPETTPTQGAKGMSAEEFQKDNVDKPPGKPSSPTDRAHKTVAAHTPLGALSDKALAESKITDANGTIEAENVAPNARSQSPSLAELPAKPPVDDEETPVDGKGPKLNREASSRR